MTPPIENNGPELSSVLGLIVQIVTMIDAGGWPAAAIIGLLAFGLVFFRSRYRKAEASNASEQSDRNATDFVADSSADLAVQTRNNSNILDDLEKSGRLR